MMLRTDCQWAIRHQLSILFLLVRLVPILDFKLKGLLLFNDTVLYIRVMKSCIFVELWPQYFKIMEGNPLYFQRFSSPTKMGLKILNPSEEQFGILSKIGSIHILQMFRNVARWHTANKHQMDFHYLDTNRKVGHLSFSFCNFWFLDKISIFKKQYIFYLHSDLDSSTLYLYHM